MKKMTPALTERLGKVLNMMLEVYDETKNGYASAPKVFNFRDTDGKVKQLGVKHGVNTEYDKEQYSGAGFIEINPKNSKEVRWIKDCPTKEDAKILYEYNSVTKSLEREKKNPGLKTKRTRKSSTLPVVATETKVEVVENKFSKPKKSTIKERLGYLHTLAYNTHNGYVSKENAFLKPVQDPTTLKMNMVDILVENHVDLKFSMNFLATTKYVDKNADGLYKWVGPTPTYKIAEEICIRLNKEKANPPTKRKKTVVVETPVVSEPVAEVTPTVQATPAVEELKPNFPTAMEVSKVSGVMGEFLSPEEFSKLPNDNYKLQYLYESWYAETTENRKAKAKMSEDTKEEINVLREIKGIIEKKMVGEE